MKLIYRPYDADRHRYLTDEEVRIYPSGKVEYYNGMWLPYPDTAEWLVIEKAVVLYDGRSHEHAK